MRALRIAAAIAAAALTLASCATVNRLGNFDFTDATVAADMPTPPDPELDIFYEVHFDPDHPLGTAISIGTNIIKASEARKIEERMGEALSEVDVAGIVARESLLACATALDAQPVEQVARADYALVLDIRKYGIRADSPFSELYLHLELTASLYARKGHELAWRRRFTFNDQMTPAVFGVPSFVDNVITAAAMSSLSVEELATGFRNMAEHSARALARRLERDLYQERYDW